MGGFQNLSGLLFFKAFGALWLGKHFDFAKKYFKIGTPKSLFLELIGNVFSCSTILSKGPCAKFASLLRYLQKKSIINCLGGKKIVVFAQIYAVYAYM